ncbi:hypothetical protein Patl1_26147 [Pistacia atlantica]|uniref:Uncharacterized protein n=1 Tax=Pistacia atlantica TaxID=434234 RepID=A0ACC1B096_9ROSI|nr:hypothetical protein Patl1_26147 [Pistacia atlantica]
MEEEICRLTILEERDEQFNNLPSNIEKGLMSQESRKANEAFVYSNNVQGSEEGGHVLS